MDSSFVNIILWSDNGHARGRPHITEIVINIECKRIEFVWKWINVYLLRRGQTMATCPHSHSPTLHSSVNTKNVFAILSNYGNVIKTGRERDYAGIICQENQNIVPATALSHVHHQRPLCLYISRWWWWCCCWRTIDTRTSASAYTNITDAATHKHFEIRWVIVSDTHMLGSNTLISG